jgi:DNA-binding MarR family transcriptional regulator
LYRLIGDTHQLDGLPQAIQGFLRAFDTVRKRLAVEAGVNGTELRALSRIAEATTITPKALSDFLELSTPAVSALTNQLVDNGLIVRIAHPHDRRSLLLELTPAGHAIMETMYLDFQKSIDDAVHVLADDESAVFQSALVSVAEQLASNSAADSALAPA